MNVVIRFALVLSLAGCGGGETADTVLIVDEEGMGFQGQIAVEIAPDGTLQPKLWEPGNIVIFRIDDTLAGQVGEAGMAYRLTEERQLDPIGEIDLSKTDTELAAEFGVEIQEPPGE